ncbi:MAG: septum formation protein Maf [Ruminococcaceae bacterium]|nr:septum formation protein Maf [Oscillospiraceae bacterium]
MLILASKSPRRRELIETLGRPFTVKTANADETLPSGLTPAEAVTLLATRKAEAGAVGESPDDVVIGADTLVFYENEPLGKPKDEKDAVRMLTLLSGTEHLVLTGVAVVHGGVTLAAADTTVVRFRKLTEKEILRYVKTGEPMDKAGAYGIQGKGGKLVESYRGNFDNVIGLPCTLLASLIETAEKRYKMKRITQKLKEIYPDAACALKYGGDPWRLLVMGRLSAQCTDKRVNEVSLSLFEKYPTPEAMRDADLAELQEAVRPCGLHITKGHDLKESAALLLSRFDGKLPDTMEELLLFPGVGRKIANLLLGDVFGKPAVVTDTHFIRICGRLGAYPETEKNPFKIERIMTPLLSPDESADFCHRIVQFGRDTCTARTPRCEGCPLSSLCDHAKQK